MRKYIVVLLTCLGTVALQAQDEVVLKVNGTDVTKQEFEYIFKKNNRDSAITKASLDEYLDLFIKFKLKVTDAEQLQMDTVPSFKKELKGYREQLARPYLSDQGKLDELLEEAIKRSHTEIKASHILVKCNPDATPEDTLAAWNKMNAIRDRIVGGENFETVAVQVSEDPSAKKNKGSLGYFSVLQMVYPFENAAYKTEVGQVSEILRTSFGYHILEVKDKRDTRGQIRVAHILVKSQDVDSKEQRAQAEQKVSEIVEKLKAGEDFALLAKQFSDDLGSASKGGELPLFGAGANTRMIEEFEEQSYALKEDGAVSEPFLTQFGWHIVKRLELKQRPADEELSVTLKQRVKRDSRSKLGKTMLLNRLKEEYNFTEDKEALRPIIGMIDSTILKQKWTCPDKNNYQDLLFSIADKKVTQEDFIEHLMKHQRVKPGQAFDRFARIMYKRFQDDFIIRYEDSKLEEKYPEFKALMKEYRDGILLFELTDQKVWSKAVEDSAGLDAFYQENKMNYMWGERVDATVYTCADEKIAKAVRKRVMKGENNGTIIKESNADSQLNLKIESDKYIKGDHPVVDQIDWKKGVSKPIKHNEQFVFVQVHEVLPSQPKLLKENRGAMIAQYQNQLEEQWITELKAKYPVEVDKDVLYSIK